MKRHAVTRQNKETPGADAARKLRAILQGVLGKSFVQTQGFDSDRAGSRVEINLDPADARQLFRILALGSKICAKCDALIDDPKLDMHEPERCASCADPG